MTPTEQRALNQQRYEDAGRWYARYRYSPRRLRNIVRQWLRHLPGRHCLVDNGEGDNWFGYRCKKCGRRVTVSLHDGLFDYRVERGCPLTDAWAAVMTMDAEAGPADVSVLD